MFRACSVFLNVSSLCVIISMTSWGQTHPFVIKDKPSAIVAKYWTISMPPWETMLVSREEMEYTRSGELLQWELYGRSGDTWVFESRKRYEYKNDSLLLSWTERGGVPIQLQRKAENEYDSIFHPVVYTEYNWNGSWEPDLRWLYEWNTDGRLLRKTKQEYKDSVWSTKEKYLYSYDTTQKSTEEIKERCSEQGCDTTVRMIDRFSADGFNETINYYKYSGGNWTDSAIERYCSSPGRSDVDSILLYTYTTGWELRTAFIYTYENRSRPAQIQHYEIRDRTDWYRVNYKELWYDLKGRMTGYSDGDDDNRTTYEYSYDGLYIDTPLNSLSSQSAFLSASPNPFTDVLCIHYHGDTQPMRLAVFDMLGRTRYETLIRSSEGSGTEYLPLHNLPPGCYVVSLIESKGFARSLSVLKSR